MKRDEGDYDLALPAGLSLPLDDDAGPARSLSPAQARAMIAAAVDAWPGVQAPADPSPTTAPTPTPTAAGAALVKPFLVGVVVATAVCLTTVVTVVSLVRPPEPEVRAAPSIAPPPIAPAPAPSVEPIAPAEPIADAPESAPEVPERARPSEARADDLLERANRLRGEGSFREADALYGRVAREHHRTFAAYVAEVASASLHLETLDDARGAERGFARALRLRPNGPLDLEALDGLARARRALGDTSGEADALRTLASRHAGSRLATRATARLAELAPSTQ